MSKIKNRIEAIDYMRGLMALSILIYHFATWTIGAPGPGTLLGRLGVYGVSTFYIVSGMSLYVASRSITWSVSEFGGFWKRRFLRIAPIYWLACGLVISMNFWANGAITIPTEKIVANLSLTFGVTNPGNYIPTGGWSIGNEMTFYLFFPLLMIFAQKPALFVASIAAIAAVYLYFAYFMLTPDKTLGAQWQTYINPLNQAFLFASGVAIGHASDRFRKPSKAMCWAILTVSITAFILVPGENLVAGNERVVFTAICMLASFACFNIGLAGKAIYEKPLKLLGEISFSVYMLHGALFSLLYTKLYAKHLSEHMTQFSFAFLIVAPVVIIASIASYKFLEKPFIKLGRKPRPIVVTAKS